MKSIFEIVIDSKKYDLADMLKKINTYHISGDLSDEEKEQLINKARLYANAENEVNLLDKIVELELRVKALEKGKTEEETETYPEWKEHKWYYRGDKCSEKGINYNCIAPEGVVCTWSPSKYPAYWEAV